MTRPCLIASLLAVLFAAPPALAGSARPEPVTVAKAVQTTSGPATTTTLQLNVASGGCTRAADFKLTVTQRASDQVLHVDRIKADFCELHAPLGTVVELSTTELVPGKAIVVDNPLFVGRV